MARLSEVPTAAGAAGGSAAGGSAAGGSVAGRRTAARAALVSGQRWRRAVRWLGLAIFLLGAGLLGYVFLQALNGFQRFTRPDYLAKLIPYVKDQDLQKTAIAAVTAIASELLQVLYLLLLGYLASVIAAKGIQFFAASDSIIDEAVTSGFDGDMELDAEV